MYRKQFYKTIAGLENLEIVRPAYAIEYDCIDPLDLKAESGKSSYRKSVLCRTV